MRKNKSYPARNFEKGILPFFLLLSSLTLLGQTPFKPGESISYDVSYHWGVMWVDAGKVSFTVADTTTSEGSPGYYFKGAGRTLSRWDWFYKVRDTYASIATEEGLAPTYFYRSVREGSTFIERIYRIDYSTQSVRMIDTDKSGEKTETTFPITKDANDVLTMIYAARKIPYHKFEVGDEIPIQLILDGKIYDTHINFEGYEWVELEDRGFIHCIKFKPRLIKGTIFPGGERMEVWVSNDANRIPVLIKTPILVGDIEVTIKKTEGIISPLKFYDDKP